MTNGEAIKMLKTILRTVYLGNRKFIEAVEKAISALEKQTCDGCIFNKRWKEDNCIDCARKAIDKYQRPLPEPYEAEEEQ